MSMNDKDYKYICFDLDGTLTKSEFGIITAARYALSKFGIEEPDRAKLLRFIGPPLYISFDEYYGLKGQDLEDAIEYFRDIYDNETYKEAPLFDGIEEVLDSLKSKGKTIIMVTSKPGYMAQKVAANTGIDKFFDHIVAPGAEMKDPSKADLLRKAMEYMGNDDRKTMIMIGDRRYDIEGACEVDVDSIGVLYGYGSKEELTLAGATYLVDEPADILKITI